jgi:hypothetical protein
VLPRSTASVTNAFWYDAKVATSSTVVDDLVRCLTSGDQITGKASVTGVVGITIYGTEIGA